MKPLLIRVGLCLWLVGILFPLAGLGRFSPAYRSAFNNTFGQEWVHWVMHAGLFAGLVVLLFFAGQSWPGQFQPVQRWFAWLALGLVLLVGIGQESLQALSAGAGTLGGSVFDLGVDLAGGLIGLGLIFGLKRIG